ncbi:hypothetical protein MCP1_1720001 [Candidatus Terasakiella magnetica]|nr:hypothetical protein MCP1_1720001 [Candidatus Terasakiella magnetica]
MKPRPAPFQRKRERRFDARRVADHLQTVGERVIRHRAPSPIFRMQDRWPLYRWLCHASIL